jgi:hypothetical protein
LNYGSQREKFELYREDNNQPEVVKRNWMKDVYEGFCSASEQNPFPLEESLVKYFIVEFLDKVLNFINIEAVLSVTNVSKNNSLNIKSKEVEYAVSTIESFIGFLKKEAKDDAKIIQILKLADKEVKSKHPGWEQKRGKT